MYEYTAEVVGVVDGDTIDVIIDLGFITSLGNKKKPQRLRLAGIDAPEKRTRDPEEKRKGVASMLFLKDILEKYDNKIIIHTEKDDSFGRYIATVYLETDSKDNINVTSLLVSRGHAVFKEY